MSRIAATLLLIAVSATPLAAKPKHWHEDEKRWNEHWRDDDRGDHARHAGCYVGPHDVRIVREYYEPRYRALPPGLAKKYARTGQLPPGWAKKIEPLPIEVERRLEPLPREYRRGYLDGRIVVYLPGEVVVDVVPLFAR